MNILLPKGAQHQQPIQFVYLRMCPRAIWVPLVGGWSVGQILSKEKGQNEIEFYFLIFFRINATKSKLAASLAYRPSAPQMARGRHRIRTCIPCVDGFADVHVRMGVGFA